MYLEKYSDYWLNEIFELRRQQLFRSLNEIHPTSIKGRKLGSGNFKSKPVQLACRGKDIVKVVIIQKKYGKRVTQILKNTLPLFAFTLIFVLLK